MKVQFYFMNAYRGSNDLHLLPTIYVSSWQLRYKKSMGIGIGWLCFNIGFHYYDEKKLQKLLKQNKK